jgi:hypothetical protein
MRTALVFLVPALCAGLATSAWADNDKDKGHGKGHGQRAQAVVSQPVRVVVPDRDRQVVYTYYRTEFANGRCPPGLARKGNGCLPPGQANGQVRNVWVVGQPLPPTVIYQPVPPVLVERLEPVPPGYGYVQVDNDVLLMDMANRIIADVVNDLSLD